MANSLKAVAVTQLTNSFSTIYTVPTSTTFTVSMIHLVNVTGSAITVRICLVPSAGSPTIANALLWDIPIPAYDFIEFGKGDMWLADATLQAYAASNSSINIKISGVETT